MVRPKNGLYGLVLAAAVFTAMAWARPAVAQDGSVLGSVVDAQGKPVEGATIVIEMTDSGRKFTSKTDKKGEFTQIGLISGNYSITVEKDGVKTNLTRRLQGGGRQNRLPPLVLTNAATGAAAAELQKAFNEGVEADKAGNHDEAIAKFQKAIELSPKCGDCYFNMGLAQAGKKDYASAEASFKKVIEIKPESSEAYNGLANIYNSQRKFDDAAAASAKAAQFASSAPGALVGGGNADAAFNQGVILWNAGKIADAKKQFEAAVAANPNHAEAHYQLGMALVNEGNLKGAGAEFDTYLKLAPNGPNAATAKAMAAQLPK
jgi:tetratricopeptide (TPR) repeat protein